MQEDTSLLAGTKTKRVLFYVKKRSADDIIDIIKAGESYYSYL